MISDAQDKGTRQRMKLIFIMNKKKYFSKPSMKLILKISLVSVLFFHFSAPHAWCGVVKSGTKSVKSGTKSVSNIAKNSASTVAVASAGISAQLISQPAASSVVQEPGAVSFVGDPAPALPMANQNQLSMPPSARTEQAQPALNPALTPRVDVFVQNKMSFLNFAKSVEISPDPSKPSTYIVKAVVYNDGNPVLAGNYQSTVPLTLPLVITGMPGNFKITDSQNQDVKDLIVVKDPKLFTLILASQDRTKKTLKDLMARPQAFLVSSCGALSFEPQAGSALDAAAITSKTFYTLQATCDMGFGYPYISVITLTMNQSPLYNIYDSDGQVVTNISNLNGMLQLEYGVNGMKSRVPHDEESLDAPLMQSVFKTPSVFGKSYGSKQNMELAKNNAALGVSGPNPYTNTPTLFHLMSRNFDFLKSCSSIALDYTDGESGYKISASCYDHQAGFVPVQLFVSLQGQNGRYRVADVDGRQIKEILFQEKKLVPIYAQVPDIDTLVARKLSIFNPQMCMRNSIKLTQGTTPFSYTVSATCASLQKVNKESSVVVNIVGKDGQFGLEDENGVPLIDVYNDDGQLKITSWLKIFSANPAYDITTICKDFNLEVKSKETKSYKLSATCPKTSGGSDFVQSTLDIGFKDNDGVVEVYNEQNQLCKRVSVVDGNVKCLN